MKKIYLISVITVIVGLIFYMVPHWFRFLWGWQLLLLPALAGVLMVLVQKEEKSYKFLPKLIIGSLLTSFIFGCSLQFFECFNYQYGPHCPIPNIFSVAPFALLLAGISVFGGLIGIVIKGAILLLKKNPESKILVSQIIIMNKKIKKKYKITIAVFLLILFIVLVNKNVNKFRKNICSQEDLNRQAALVLGARVWDNGEMSDIFKDRVITAIDLYKEGKVEKILVSGDHGQKNYDEVNTAKKYLQENNVELEDIFLDHAGFDTYDSLYRAKHVFKAQSLVVVTQDFHLPRALYISNELGIDSCGVSADRQKYYGESARNRREILAKVKAWFNVVFHSRSKYLGDEIPLSGSGLKSWD